MKRSLLVFGIAIALLRPAAAQQRNGPPLLGRWDLVVHSPQGDYPSWLEVKSSGFATLVGYFVGQFGSMRPISKVEFNQGTVRFAVPVQWEFERNGKDLLFEGTLSGNTLSGTCLGDKGETLRWTAKRAPKLQRAKEPQWGTPFALFNGKDLTGWKPRHAGAPNGWTVKSGILVNAKPGNDIMTTRNFTDFQLLMEFRYPKGSNSGVYLRGRYEAQIEDGFGQEPEEHGIGGIYGFLKPRINAAKRAGEWQTYHVILVGRRVTIVLNGETVIDRQEIPGITGGALDSNEGAPGPLFIQGDHGPVEFRKITLTPTK